jgi:DNA-binding SARP family transcriptional activator
MASDLEIRVLGELVVTRGGRSLPLPASKKTRALLGYLAVTGREHTRERLCELLWPGPDDPRAALRWSLTKLRTVLGPRGLDADRERVGLSTFPTDLAAVRAAIGADLESASTVDLSAAVARFHGELCEGLALPDCYRYQEWHTAERQAARALHVSLLTALVRRLAAEPERALAWARQWVSIEPLSEAAHAAVVRCLAKLGHKREALAQYAACAKILEQELGARPSSELLEARMQIGSASVPAAGTEVPERRPTPPRETGELRPASDPLVGREAELAVLDGMLERARAGEPHRVLFVLGEPGIGKSRVLEELGRRAAGSSGAVLSGRAFEPEMVRPYGPWVDALRGMVVEIPTELRSELTALMPELGGAGASDRIALFDSVARLLRHLAGKAAPLVVLLDDAHWFDEASAAMLHYVARAVAEPHVLFACAARPGELSDNPAALRMVRGLLREGRSRSLELGPLEPTAIAAIARRLSPDVDAERVVRESEGNPLLALELSRALESGNPAAWDSMGGLIAERLAGLEASVSDLLSWAAALGRSFDLATLERVTAVPPLELVARMSELERHGLVRASADGTRFEFAHDLLRAGSYQRLSEPSRRVVHRTIARALAVNGVECAQAGEITHHAALGGDSELAARAALSAAQRCLRMFAMEEAVRLAEVGLSQVLGLPRDESIRKRIELFAIYAFSGSLSSRAPRVQIELNRAVLEAIEAGLSVEAATGFHALSVLQFDRGDLGAAHASTLRAASAVREANPIKRAEQLGGTARCLAVLERDLADAEAMYREARAISNATGAYSVGIECAGAYLAAHAGQIAEAHVLFERGLELARIKEDRWSEFECLRAVVQLELEARSPAKALARLPQLLDVASKMGEGSELVVARALDSLARFCRGDDGAEALLEEAIVGLRGADTKGVLAIVLGFAAERDIDEGRVEMAERRAEEALRAAEAVSRKSQAALARTILARVALALGDAVTARRQIEGFLSEPNQRLLSARARDAIVRLSQAG